MHQAHQQRIIDRGVLLALIEETAACYKKAVHGDAADNERARGLTLSFQHSHHDESELAPIAAQIYFN